MTAIITSPIRLTVEQINYLQITLKKIFNEVLPVQNIIDKNILAGFTVKVGEWYLDASLKTELNNLQQILL
ncbi:hypothetical protein A3D78_05485 [Candidatus Gottesmanbacteria bacterium RIFCSPHIGHO2_02_FULL_39_14]|uniref:Uncharacterized protein n=3 Tax=Candidatus Gottesmaniibacteriota TaxID=1752720 RepID=A0A1F6A391_9BACT|nr:MAG: hypothetical protein A2153_03360 [Candidatus Gottesmanbacteria bacterium RBG_16_38_7b]OGG19178.1 MAG: hypothetical protein A3D78_05485 [Candidatus Gottesmanbacteria bacterium RIFCSPHIGHO2_02_FULL_39_14]OGG31639.1 MAG: hypothetical protein A3I51_00265 [Candidatus Gottesmanbacteria bacterium RIFCSPLOWO2_02_FULL_38_8]